MEPHLTTQLIDDVVTELNLKSMPTDYGRVVLFGATSTRPGLTAHFEIQADGEVFCVALVPSVAFPADARPDLLVAVNEWHSHHRWPCLSVNANEAGDQLITAACNLGIEADASVSWIAEQVTLAIRATMTFWDQFSGGPDPTASLIAGLEEMLRTEP